MRIALFLTVLRILLSPFFVVIYLYHEQMHISVSVMPYCLLSILIVCELTDIFDGFFARRSNQVTDLGKVLDPMADSIVRTSLLLTFTQGVVQIPLLLVLVFIYRDGFISLLRILCALKGEALAARMSGKIKAIVQAVTVISITTLLIPYSLGSISLETLQWASFYIVAVAAIYTVISGIEYTLVNYRYILKAWKG